MDGVTIITQLNQKIKDLDKCINTLGAFARAKTESERDYRIELAKLVLTLKSEGTAISIIETVSKGEPKVAGLKMEWDIASSKYDNAVEASQAIKKEIDVLRELAQREWSVSK